MIAIYDNLANGVDTRRLPKVVPFKRRGGDAFKGLHEQDLCIVSDGYLAHVCRYAYIPKKHFWDGATVRIANFAGFGAYVYANNDFTYIPMDYLEPIQMKVASPFDNVGGSY